MHFIHNMKCAINNCEEIIRENLAVNDIENTKGLWIKCIKRECLASELSDLCNKIHRKISLFETACPIYR